MDYKKAYEEINAHPGKLAHDNWANLKVTYSGIFVVNRSQLLTLLDSPTKSDELIFELIQNVRSQKVKEAFQSEMLRMLHNYIASASSLVDHSRRFVKKYSGSEFGAGYDKKREVVAATGEHCFLKDLRNYLMHVGIPPIGYTIKISKDGKETFIAQLTSSKLLEWDKWSKTARAYIEGSGDHVQLVPLIKSHAAIIDEFYNWIFDQFGKLHGAEIEEVNELIRATVPKWVQEERRKADQAQ